MALKRDADGNLPKKSRKKVEKFIFDQQFKYASPKHRSSGKEYVFLCPFCEGGRTNEVSFNVNITKGTARCWRASCNFRGSIEWFVHKYLDISYERAENLVHGDEDATLDNLEKDLNLAKEHINRDIFEGVQSIFGDDEGGFESAWIEGSKPIEGAEDNTRASIYQWIKSRGYDVQSFINKHNLYVPPQQDLMNGRVLFEVKTEGNRAYQAYSFDDSNDLKTLNPGGGILSSDMLYKYDFVDKISPKRVFLCEGIFDVARIMSFGYVALCCFGVYVSERQISLISDLDVDEICIAFDQIKENDEHGTSLLYDLASDIDNNVLDKQVSILKINEKDFIGNEFQKGMDPDDLTKKQFLAYWKNREVLADRESRLVNSFKGLQ